MRLTAVLHTSLITLVVLLIGAKAGAQSQLLQPDPEFKGQISETFKDSTPSYPQPVKAKPGSPNVLIILTDDTLKRSPRSDLVS
jgi:hypothetical protein